MIKINHASLSLTIAVLTSILAIAVGENTYLANAETQTTTCNGDTCHSDVCINGICHASSTNSTKIVQNQNSSIP